MMSAITFKRNCFVHSQVVVLCDCNLIMFLKVEFICSFYDR